MFGFEAFKDTPLGRQIGKVLNDPVNVASMITMGTIDKPAVLAIGKQIMAIGKEAESHDVRIFVGRWVREILEPHGLVPVTTGRVKPGNLFVSGTVYGRPKPGQEAKGSKGPQQSAA